MTTSISHLSQCKTDWVLVDAAAEISLLLNVTLLNILSSETSPITTWRRQTRQRRGIWNPTPPRFCGRIKQKKFGSAVKSGIIGARKNAVLKKISKAGDSQTPVEV